MKKAKDTWSKHTNPDGSQGGWVPSSANIDPEATVEPSALVNPGATLGAGERVLDGQMVTRDGEIIKFTGRE